MDKYLIKGKLYDPILFGNEDEDWVFGDRETATCGDCGCKVGEQHLKYCDIERCPCCELQLLSCDCGVIYNISKDMEKHLAFYIEQQRIENKKLEQEMKELYDRLAKKNQDTEM